MFPDRGLHRGPTRYRLGLGELELDSEDGPLTTRFAEIYPEGEATTDVGDAVVRVRCTVRLVDEPAVAAVAFDDPRSVDPAAFCRAVFPDRNYVAGPPAPAGWTTLALAHSPAEPVVAMNGPHLVADRRKPWQPFVANLAVNRVLRLQDDVLFFHAAAAAVAGRGVMFAGPKESGKTTLSLTLASRGWPFLGDEITSLRPGDRALFPFRRAASIRPGIRTERVTRRLAEGRYPTETFPDGGQRVLANVAALFPQARAPGPTRLGAMFFLGGFGPRARAEPFAFGREHFGLLTPLASSLWSAPGRRMLQLSRLAQDVRCYHLEAGPPDETADLVETLAKELPI